MSFDTERHEFESRTTTKIDNLKTELELLKTTTDDKMTILKSGFNSEINDLRLANERKNAELKDNIKGNKNEFDQYKDQTDNILMGLTSENIKIKEEFDNLQDILLKLCFILPVLSIGITLLVIKAINFIK